MGEMLGEPAANRRRTGGKAGSGARWLALGPIVAYRRVVSPFLKPRCRFYPSCASYAEEAVRSHGALGGTVLAVRRVVKCHPFNPGGYDPVPAIARPASRGGSGE